MKHLYDLEGRFRSESSQGNSLMRTVPSSLVIRLTTFSLLDLRPPVLLSSLMTSRWSPVSSARWPWGCSFWSTAWKRKSRGCPPWQKEAEFRAGKAAAKAGGWPGHRAHQHLLDGTVGKLASKLGGGGLRWPADLSPLSFASLYQSCPHSRLLLVLCRKKVSISSPPVYKTSQMTSWTGHNYKRLTLWVISQTLLAFVIKNELTGYKNHMPRKSWLSCQIQPCKPRVSQNTQNVGRDEIWGKASQPQTHSTERISLRNSPLSDIWFLASLGVLILISQMHKSLIYKILKWWFIFSHSLYFQRNTYDRLFSKFSSYRGKHKNPSF